MERKKKTFLAPKIWEIVPTECKNSSSVHEFKSKIKQWTPTDCPCRLCKRYNTSMLLAPRQR